MSPSASRPPHEANRRTLASMVNSTTGHLIVGAVAGTVGAIVMGLEAGWKFAAILGWDVMAFVVVVSTWLVTWRRDAAATAELAVREDPARPIADLLLIGASLASLVGVGFIVVAGGNSKGLDKGLLVTFAIATVVVSWAVVHVTYTLRYARLFYGGTRGGVDFHQQAGELPQYSDFAYLAFTIGMTFQVSDTDVNTKVIRATVLRHAVLSYLFGVVIIAVMINLVAGLAK
jgi:uncharacterized membrane protein